MVSMETKEVSVLIFGQTFRKPDLNRFWEEEQGFYYSAFSLFSKILFDFKKSISGPIDLKFSGKTLNAILFALINFGCLFLV